MVYFQTKNYQLWKILEGLGIEKTVSYGHLNYRMAFWYISLPFGNLVAIWYIFPRFGILCQEKSGNPGPEWSHHKTFSFQKSSEPNIMQS
jgi:hypothetical protein